MKADLYIKDAQFGRGLFAVHGFKKGDIITRYDGVWRTVSGAAPPPQNTHTHTRARALSAPSQPSACAAIVRRLTGANPPTDPRGAPDRGLEKVPKTHMLRIPQSQNIIDGRPLVLAARGLRRRRRAEHTCPGSLPLAVGCFSACCLAASARQVRGKRRPRDPNPSVCPPLQSLRLERAADHSGRWWCAPARPAPPIPHKFLPPLRRPPTPPSVP